MVPQCQDITYEKYLQALKEEEECFKHNMGDNSA